MLRSLVVIFVYLLYTFYPVLADSDVTLDIHNVGQGHCATLSVKNKETGEIMFFMGDGGSSAHKKEIRYTKSQEPLEQKIKIPSSPSTPAKVFPLLPSPPRSVKKSPDFQATLDKDYDFPEEIEKSHIEELRKKLIAQGATKEQTEPKGKRKGKRKETSPSLYIRTVVITHPDIDHYGWLTKLFNKPHDHIDYLIFGGLPEAYDVSEKLNFKNWLSMRLERHTKIYFPAIKYDHISSLEEAWPHEGRKFAPQRYATPESPINELKTAFNFGEDINIYPLSVNPTHMAGKEGILRLSEPEDDNRDSLVLKIEHGGASAILTGDATGVTTRRIMDNYSDNKDFLKANVLLASHHGSATHESNNKEWIKAVSPEYVIISNGHSLGHPHEETYNHFKESTERLKKVKMHRVLTGNTMEEEPLEYSEPGILHQTERAIFSTLNSGTITIKLHSEGTIGLSTEVDGVVEILSSRKAPADEFENVDVKLGERELLISPHRVKSLQLKRESATYSPTMSPLFSPMKFTKPFLTPSGEEEEEEEKKEEIKELTLSSLKKDRSKRTRPVAKPEKSKETISLSKVIPIAEQSYFSSEEEEEIIEKKKEGKRKKLKLVRSESNKKLANKNMKKKPTKGLKAIGSAKTLFEERGVKIKDSGESTETSSLLEKQPKKRPATTEKKKALALKRGKK